ncbi:MAG TPA: hypothetical protein VFE78_35280, partial [Gemmataceae bacterium]|nr:hypothetical protein [Gemmataceae bacterium]
MPRPQSLLALALIVVLVGLAPARDDAPLSSPPTPKKPVTDVYHGVKVVDDYRWLENAEGPGVRQWTEAQNKYARAVLDKSPALRPLRERLKALLGAPSPGYADLQLRGETLFALKRQPPKEQPFLVRLDSSADPASAKVILDPNVLDAKGKTAIDFYVPSRDGKLVAVSLSEGGSEEGTVYVYEVASGKRLKDVIPRVQFPTAGGDVAWDADSAGFFYTRYPRGEEKPEQDRRFYQQVYHHKLGTPTEEDTYALGKGLPRIAEIFLDPSPDGRYLLATVQNGDGGEFEHYLRGPDGKWTQLTRWADGISAAAFGRDKGLYLLSRKGAPRGKILRLTLDRPALAGAVTVVEESDVAIEGLRFGSNRLYPTIVPSAT